MAATATIAQEVAGDVRITDTCADELIKEKHKSYLGLELCISYEV